MTTKYSWRKGVPRLKVLLQKDVLHVCRTVDGEDRVRGVSSFYEGGNTLAQVQVVQVTGSHALRGGYTCIDLHLAGPTKKREVDERGVEEHTGELSEKRNQGTKETTKLIYSQQRFDLCLENVIAFRKYYGSQIYCDHSKF